MAMTTIRDFDNLDDALELMRRNAGDSVELPGPDTGILTEALGLRPVPLRDVATYIGSAAHGSENGVRT
jgi:hypothetical protein